MSDEKTLTTEQLARIRNYVNNGWSLHPDESAALLDEYDRIKGLLDAIKLPANEPQPIAYVIAAPQNPQADPAVWGYRPAYGLLFGKRERAEEHLPLLDAGAILCAVIPVVDVT